MASSSLPLIECVPNFSEGRDPAVIAAIREAILRHGDCELWDYSSDRDHNRSVFTLAGPPEALEETVLRFVHTASELIDMERHEGVHPCIGAADVIPFVPLRNSSMEDCIRLSEKTGERIARELSLPVYLYARSARVPAHRRLADIRRGGFERLRAEIAAIPERAPDFGPKNLGKAGGVSIGARDFLIAFNVFLNTSDPSPARRIAREIRESSGGFPGVQAIGLPVSGLAQVSMNFLDYRRSSLAEVFGSICQKCTALGVEPLYSELIGMLPEDALDGTDPQALLLKDFNESRILERHF